MPHRTQAEIINIDHENSEATSYVCGANISNHFSIFLALMILYCLRSVEVLLLETFLKSIDLL